MRKGLKGIANRTWKPFLQWYLRKPRTFSQKGIRVNVPPGVFHPGFFFSTGQLVDFLRTIPLEGKSLLEIGSGSGFVSIFAAKKGAAVFSVDISEAAVTASNQNAIENKAEMKVVRSDLFESIPARTFDLIAVNPPFYKKNPQTSYDHAWYAGEELQYFKRFFSQAKSFVHSGSRILMVLSDECDVPAIRSIATNENWQWKLAAEKKGFFETGFIFNITPADEKMN